MLLVQFIRLSFLTYKKIKLIPFRIPPELLREVVHIHVLKTFCIPFLMAHKYPSPKAHPHILSPQNPLLLSHSQYLALCPTYCRQSARIC